SSAAVNPMHSGLSTPSSAVQDVNLAPMMMTMIDGDDYTSEYAQSQSTLVESGLPPLVSFPVPKATLAELPWEIKVMILRALDQEGLLSDRQFQSIVNYARSRWETTRKGWERWGEIREIILIE